MCTLACAHAAGARQLSEASAQLDADGRWVNGVTESWWQDDGITRDDAAAAAARWKEIGDELARAGADAWAGDYFRGSETHGTYMRWSPRSGFVIAHVDKCRAAVMGLTYGRVEATPVLVQFFPEVEKRSSHGHGGHVQGDAAPRPVMRFVPVVWRGKGLLVAEDEMEEFGDYVAGLGSHNGQFLGVFLEYEQFFRGPDRGGRGGDAPPVVPPGYERFIKKPIEARVTSAGRRALKRDYTLGDENTSRTYERASVTPVTIDAGTERGVKEGMIFRVTRPAEGDTVVVLRAGRRASEAVVVRDVDERGTETFYDDAESREKRHTRVARGWRLTTSLYD